MPRSSQRAPGASCLDCGLHTNLVAADFRGRAAAPMRLAACSAKSCMRASCPSGDPSALRGPGLSGAPQEVRVAHLAEALSDHALEMHAAAGSCASSTDLPVPPGPSGAALVAASKTTMRECPRSRRPAQLCGPWPHWPLHRSARSLSRHSWKSKPLASSTSRASMEYEYVRSQYVATQLKGRQVDHLKIIASKRCAHASGPPAILAGPATAAAHVAVAQAGAHGLAQSSGASSIEALQGRDAAERAVMRGHVHRDVNNEL